MNNKHVSALDPQQMLHRTFDDTMDAQRVVLVGDGNIGEMIAASVSEAMRNATFDISPVVTQAPVDVVGHYELKEIRVPELIREVQIVQVPQIIKEIEYREIEKTVLVTEYKTIEVPVVVKEIQIIEKPVVVVERVQAEFPKFFKALIVIQTIASILFTAIILFKK